MTSVEAPVIELKMMNGHSCSKILKKQIHQPKQGTKVSISELVPGVPMQGIDEVFQSHTPLLMCHCEIWLLLQTWRLIAHFLQ
jgi:hypothetical protein